MEERITAADVLTMALTLMVKKELFTLEEVLQASDQSYEELYFLLENEVIKSRIKEEN